MGDPQSTVPGSGQEFSSATKNGLPVGSAWEVVASAVVLFVAWSGLRSVGGNSEILPSIGEVWSAAGEMSTSGFGGGSSIWVHLAATAGRLIAAWIGGMVAGSALGIVIGSNQTAHRALNPLINLMRFVVPGVFLGLIVSWFGIGGHTSVLLSGVLPFWIATEAVAGIQRNRIEGASYLEPMTMGQLVIMARISLLAAFLMLSSLERVGTDTGLAALAHIGATFFRRDIMYLAFLILALLGVSLDSLVRYVGRRSEDWVSAR